MRKPNWYYRMLLSYFPIFLFTVTILVFLSFTILNEISHQETVKADRISTEYVVDAVDRSLRGMELGILEDMEKNELFRRFLQGSAIENATQGVFEAASRLRQLTVNDSLIHSVYLYRRADQRVLTRSGLEDLNHFADRDFVAEAERLGHYSRWSTIRDFKEFSNELPKEVITMYKPEPLPFGTDGLLFINADVYAIGQLIRSMNNQELSFLNIRDDQGKLLFSTRAVEGGEIRSGESVLNVVQSELTGWHFESGIVGGQLFMWVSVISYVWIAIGIGTVLFAGFYIIYITRRNYKPIRVMMNRIESIQLRHDSFGMRLDELSQIDRTLEGLIQQTVDYEKQQRENLLVTRRQLFVDLTEGIAKGDLLQQFAHLKLYPSHGAAALDKWAYVAVELNEYTAFTQDFTDRDQAALKFAIVNVLQELARGEQMEGWVEWTGDRRIGIMIGHRGTGGAAAVKADIGKFASAGADWIREYLRMGLLFGIGPLVPLQEMNASCREATQVMRHKLALGRETVVMSDDLPRHIEGSWYRHLQLASSIVREFRLSTGEWREQLEQLMQRVREERLKDEEIRLLLHTLLEMLGTELGHLSEELRTYIQGEKAEQWKRALEEVGTLDQLTTVCQDYMTELYRTYVAMCETKNHRAMVTEMRGYIEEHFQNPDLSLNHLSDRFQISPKYASYLFKEEFNMKFVDFLIRLRIMHAEQLLASTARPVQEIATEVGYANAITFGRVFKRVVGVTPGEFRKLGMTPSEPYAKKV